MIFAPDNPEKKEWYAPQAIQYADKKPIFLDKTFTDTYASAVRIYEAAKAAETPLFSGEEALKTHKLICEIYKIGRKFF